MSEEDIEDYARFIAGEPTKNEYELIMIDEAIEQREHEIDALKAYKEELKELENLKMEAIEDQLIASL